MQQIIPTPGIVHPGIWHVENHPQEGHGGTDIGARRMLVPLDDSPGSAFVRQHEMAHATISPDVEKVMKSRKRRKLQIPTHTSIQVAEDLRIDAWQQYIGLSIIDPDFGDYAAFVAEKIAKPAAVGDLYSATCMAVAAHFPLQEVGAGIPQSVRVVKAKLREAIDRVILRRQFKDVIELALMLDLLRPGKPANGGGTEEGNKGSVVKWGAVEVLEPERTRPRDGSLVAISSMQGVDLSDPSRIFTDCRPFERIVPMQGQGSFLIDCSSSMCWTPDALHKLVESRPEASVALYAGHKVDGRLVIVAKDGEAADASECMRLIEHLGNNTIDGHGLEWLSQQPEPRYWFSDGQATQPNGNHGAAQLECIRLCAENSIQRITRIPD